MQNKRPKPSPDLLKRFLACKCSAEEEGAIARWYQSLGLERRKLQLLPEEEKTLKRKLWLAIHIRQRVHEPYKPFFLTLNLIL